MFDENQIIKMKWINFNRDWYESKGYIFTKYNDIFDILAKDLPLKSIAKITATCDYCGEKYDTHFMTANNAKRSNEKNACCNCAGKKANELSRKRRATKYICGARNKLLKNGYKLITTENEYVDIKMNVVLECSKHGEQEIRLESALRGGRCPKCARELVGKKNRLDIDYIEQYINDINGNILLNKNDYISNGTRNLNILCSCGNVFITSFSGYVDGVQQCFSCSCKESIGEGVVREFLEQNNILFKQEKRFDDCRDKKPLPFDFYLPDYNLIIEFDGKHHFEETGFANHEITKKHDEMKNQYCKSHNIDMLRIPYWERDNIEKIIAEKLNL